MAELTEQEQKELEKIKKRLKKSDDSELKASFKVKLSSGREVDIG